MRNILLLLSTVYYFTCSGQISKNTYKFGDLAPDAKSIDVDRFCSLSSGLCVVQKGDKEALIDVNGNFIVPWGKYQYTSFKQQKCGYLRFDNGLVKVKEPLTGHMGYISNTGQAVIPVTYKSGRLSNFLAGNVVCASVPVSAFISNQYALDAKGNIIANLNRLDINVKDADIFDAGELMYQISWKETEDDIYYEDDKNLNRFLANDYKRLGYITKYGKVAIPLQFQAANQFSEGMASVGKLDEFGVMKWGYIDSTGKLIIPYQFTSEPGPFHNGMAIVKPNSLANFTYAYIDKRGDIKFKIGGDFTPSYSPLTYRFETPNFGGTDPGQKNRGCFFYGYSVWSGYNTYYLLDTLGKFYTFKEFLSNHAYPVALNFRYTLTKIDAKGFYFTADDINVYDDDLNGLIDFSGKVIFYPVNAFFEPDYFSNYSLARFVIGKEGVLKKPVYRQGIVNKDGLFTVIKSEKKEIW